MPSSRLKFCLCTHHQAYHDGPCTYRAVNPRWLINGEGPEFLECQCPKFTFPNVRPRR